METLNRHEYPYVITMTWWQGRPPETWTIENARDARLWYGQLAMTTARHGMKMVILTHPDGTFEHAYWCGP